MLRTILGSFGILLLGALAAWDFGTIPVFRIALAIFVLVGVVLDMRNRIGSMARTWTLTAIWVLGLVVAAPSILLEGLGGGLVPLLAGFAAGMAYWVVSFKAGRMTVGSLAIAAAAVLLTLVLWLWVLLSVL